jgi:hypothetical protein
MMAYYCVKNGVSECDGCMSCRTENSFYCPVCGNEVYETVFVANDGEVIGCENCAEIKTPDEMIGDD